MRAIPQQISAVESNKAFFRGMTRMCAMTREFPRMSVKIVPNSGTPGTDLVSAEIFKVR